MTKFLNKKEQVFDLKLTSYGHYLLSVGKFKPAYYTFCDDNVLYDAQYAGTFERQNEAHDRIKNKTPYLEGLVLFEDLENLLLETSDMEINFYSSDVTATQKAPRKDIFRTDAAIGDGHIDGEPQKGPSWKIVMLQGSISSSAQRAIQNDIKIPQLNINAVYKKKIIDPYIEIAPEGIRDMTNQTGEFVDNKSILLVPDDPVIYFDEVNTALQTENFDIEVFEILTGSNSAGETITKLERKYFANEDVQIENNLLIKEKPTSLNTTAVIGDIEYYFDLMADQEVEKTMACRGALEFNKESYYIDLDFDCDSTELDEQYYDIYGSTTEPEICQ
jgi:hypothetical protein